MSKAHQDRIVEVMREAGADARWSAAALAKRTGIGKIDVVRAVQSLRFAGKMEFSAYRLMPSLMEQDGDESGIPQLAAEDAGTGRTGGGTIAPDARAEAGAEVVAGPPSAPAEASQPDLRAAVEAEAHVAERRRKAARVNGGGVGTQFAHLAPLAPLSPAEQLLTVANSEFAEFAGHLKRRWPGLWFMALETARQQDRSALRVLYEAVQLGLEQMQGSSNDGACGACGQRRSAA